MTSRRGRSKLRTSPCPFFSDFCAGEGLYHVLPSLSISISKIPKKKEKRVESGGTEQVAVVAHGAPLSQMGASFPSPYPPAAFAGGGLERGASKRSQPPVVPYAQLWKTGVLVPAITSGGKYLQATYHLVMGVAVGNAAFLEKHTQSRLQKIILKRGWSEGGPLCLGRARHQSPGSHDR